MENIYIANTVFQNSVESDIDFNQSVLGTIEDVKRLAFNIFESDRFSNKKVIEWIENADDEVADNLDFIDLCCSIPEDAIPSIIFTIYNVAEKGNIYALNALINGDTDCVGEIKITTIQSIIEQKEKSRPKKFKVQMIERKMYEIVIEADSIEEAKQMADDGDITFDETNLLEGSHEIEYYDAYEFNN